MKIIKSSLTTFIAVIILIASFSTAVTTIRNDPSHQDYTSLHYQYKFSFPQIIQNNHSNNTHQIRINGLKTTNEYLEPRIPVKPLCLLIPYGKTITSITVELSNKKEIHNINLETGGAVLTLSQQADSSDMQNFQQNSYQSNKICKPYQIVGTYLCRGYQLLHLNMYPVQYDEATSKIDFHNTIDINIELQDSHQKTSIRNTIHDQQTISQLVDNPEIIQTYVAHPSQLPVEDQYDYVIITNQNLKHAKGNYTFQDFIDYKKSKGISTRIVTVEEITNNPDYSVNGKWGDNNLENPFITSKIQENIDRFDDTQARIRNFIRFAYVTWGTDYVLLAGDSDTNNKKDIIVPHRGLFADEQGLPLKNTANYERDDIPSDVYYACLDGNFNDDEDGHFGEAPKFNNKNNSIDESDLYAEVYVGRACVDSEEEVSNFVKKTISYDSIFYDEYLNRVLFLGEHLGSLFYFRWGGRYKDLIEPYFPEEYNITKLYQEDDSWDSQYYWYLLNEHPPLIINHDGHGSPTTAMGLDCGMIELLTNDKYYFIYSHTCLAGAFDNCFPPDTYYDIDCVAEYFTVETEHGAIGAVLNSRYGLGSQKSPDAPSGLLDESFFKAVFVEDIRQFGPANHYSKEDHIWHINENGIRWVFYQTNLFGDPEVSFKDPSPEVEISIEITYPPEQGGLILNDGDFIPLSFLEMPYIIKGLTIKADAQTEPMGLVEHVDFIINNETVHRDTTPPYEYYWNNERRGTHTIHAVATSSYHSSSSDATTAYYLW